MKPDRLTSFTDAAGHVMTLSYADSQFPALLQSATEPLGNSPRSFIFDAQGRVFSLTDAVAHTSTFAYDTPSGNFWTDPLGHVFTFAHNSFGDLTTLTDPAGAQRTFLYDPQRRPSSTTRPLGDVTAFSYDPASGLIAEGIRYAGDRPQGGRRVSIPRRLSPRQPSRDPRRRARSTLRKRVGVGRLQISRSGLPARPVDSRPA